ncbi:MAG: glutathione S-transferase family protein [Pseudomonadota bacterium]
MTYQLYYAPYSASLGVRTLLEEIGAPYKLLETTIDMDKPRPEEHLRLNPNGWVPVLIWQDGGEKRAMYECAAITIFLGDRHPEAGLAPAPDAPERGLYLQSLVYFSNTIQTAFQQDYYPDRFADTPEAQRSSEVRGQRRLRETFGVIDEQIGDQDWMLGDQFSAADIYLFMLTTWIRTERGQPHASAFANIKRIADKVQARPSVQMVYADWIAEYG